MQIPTQPNVQCSDVPGELSINGQRKDQICLENLEEYPDSAHESHNIECFGITRKMLVTMFQLTICLSVTFCD